LLMSRCIILHSYSHYLIARNHLTRNIVIINPLEPCAFTAHIEFTALIYHTKIVFMWQIKRRCNVVVVIALYREEDVSCETPRVMPHFTS